MADRMRNIAGLFKQGKTRAIILVTLVILFTAIMVGIFTLRSHTKGVEASAELGRTPAGIQTSPWDAPNEEYARLQAEQNAQAAKAAEKAGGSAIPTIIRSDKETPSDLTPPDPNAGMGFTALSRTQSETGTFSPKVFSPPGTVPAVCPPVNSEPASALGTPVYDRNGRLIGYAGADGKVRDANGHMVGTLSSDGLVRDANGNVIGQKSTVITGTPIYDEKGNLLGYVDPDGNVRDTAGKIIGTVGSDSVVRDLSGKIIGKAGTPVYDANGKLLGYAGADGKIRDANGSIIGTVGPDGIAHDMNGNIIGKAGAISPGTPVYDAEGKLVGTVGPDGKVRDARGNVVNTLDVDGHMRDEQGRIVGGITKPQAAAALGSAAAAAIVPTAGSSNAEAPVLQAQQTARQQALSDYERQQAILKDQQLQQKVQQKQQAMSAQAGQLLAAWTSPVQSYVEGTKEEAAGSAGEGTNASGNSGNSAPAGSAAAATGAPPLVKAGTVYYGIIDTTINSDEPGPVMASIITGQFKGAKLLGSLTNQGKAVLITFNLMILPQVPKSISVNVVAIDQNTARTALSTYTNNHYLLRYGSLFAAAFTQGYSQAVMNSGTTTESGLFSTRTTTPPLSAQQKFAVALGNVGTQFSNQLSSVYSTPPTVHVAAGTAVGMLFLADVQAVS